jgi:hypothetical protein
MAYFYQGCVVIQALMNVWRLFFVEKMGAGRVSAIFA